ncbi:MAG: HEPN domain-containing protein [Planctomycetes bacterium]|nr:HEPN domain-containing protein [Planctomycetota bacterium]
MINRSQTIRLFQRVAAQRLTTAGFLLEHGFYQDAVYLAGYAVECSLKALILQRTPHGKFKEMMKRLTEVGKLGHDFEYLKGILKEQQKGRQRKDRELLGALADHLKIVASWSTDLRYQVGNVDPMEAEEFFEAAKAVRNLSLRS